MADILDVITLDEGKAALNITGSGFDTEVASYITAVSRRIDDLVGPVVNRAVTAELHDGWRNWVRPRYTPVSSVTTVLEYSDTTPTTLAAETPTVHPVDAYLVVTDRTPHSTMILRRSSGNDRVFVRGRRNVSLTYVAGRYATTAAVDPKFKQGAAKMLSVMWKGDQGGGSATFGAPVGEGLIPIVGFSVPRAVTDLLADEMRLVGVA